MSEFTNRIFDIKKSKSYCDYVKYHSNNILEITKVSRQEHMHSNFIAWLLNPGESHLLHTFPLEKFLLSLEFLKNKECNAEAKLESEVIWKFYEKGFIDTAEVKREYHNIDIHLLIRTKGKTLPVIIENKVKSNENDEQTDKYFNFGEAEYNDRSKYYQPMYVYLVPEFNKTSKPQNKNFLVMSYQELVENVIEPSMAMCRDEVSKANIRLYLQCLSYQYDVNGGSAMAISNEEKKILSDFIEENRNLLVSVMNEIFDEVDPIVMNQITGEVRDYSKYMFNGEEYTKNRLVLAVVKKFVEDNKPKDYKSLSSTFVDTLQGTNKGVVRLENDISPKDKGLDGGSKRYFIGEDQIIRLASGEKVVVCNQWGRGNLPGFIDYVNKELNYEIQKI